MPKTPSIRFIPTSAFGYEVHVDGHYAGSVAKAGRRWVAKTDSFELGEHPTRKEAAEAIADIDRT